MVRLKLCWCCRITFNLFMFSFFLSLFIFFIYFLDVITSKTVISRQKITILEEIPARIFQNIWRYISDVSTVSFFFFICGNLRRYLTYFQDFVSFVLFCSIYSRLSCTLVIFCVRHYLFLALWFWTVLNGSSVFEILFILFLRSKVSSRKSKCIFLSLRSVILEGSWQVDDKTRPNLLRRCDEREGCQINASLDIRLEDDPCPKTEKYLEAHYVCHSLGEGPPTQGLSTRGGGRN